jgi:voltage-gated potassium channel
MGVRLHRPWATRRLTDAVATSDRRYGEDVSSTMNRLRIALGLVGAVAVAGVIGYRFTGMSWMEAVYMTVITVTTVGYREVGGHPSNGEQIFTIFIIIGGVSTVLYTFTLGVQTVVEGQLREFVGRRRMNRMIEGFRDHTIVCGFGRVGRTVVDDLVAHGETVVIVDENPARVNDVDQPVVIGDATLDSTLRSAGIEHARALIAALEGDAENLFVTLSARTLNPELFIVARARAGESISKLSHAGADRVVNPQDLGASRMASFVVQPNVAEFVDVVMHERSQEFRIREFELQPGCWLVGQRIGDARLRDRTEALVLAVRTNDGSFITSPGPDVSLAAGDILIVVGTQTGLTGLQEALA